MEVDVVVDVVEGIGAGAAEFLDVGDMSGLEFGEVDFGAFETGS